VLARCLTLGGPRPGALQRAAEFDRHRFNSIRRHAVWLFVLSRYTIVLPLSAPLG
jgi:hypothetical protein